MIQRRTFLQSAAALLASCGISAAGIAEQQPDKACLDAVRWSRDEQRLWKIRFEFSDGDFVSFSGVREIAMDLGTFLKLVGTEKYYAADKIWDSHTARIATLFISCWS